MSFYIDIYNDFPLRCGRLWREMRDLPAAKELDVTFMLMAAAAGLATPWEHLKEIQSRSLQHPAFNGLDRNSYKKSIKILDEEFNVALIDSRLFDKSDLADWYICCVPEIGNILGAVEARSMQTNAHNVRKVRDAIRVLRNALAHNNIHAFARNRKGERPDNKISEITFFSQVRGTGSDGMHGYNVISMPVADFANFLDSWFALLKRARPDGKQLRLVVADALLEEHERLAA